METDITVSEWGNSFAVRIPKSAAKELGVKKGSHLRLKTDSEGLHFLKPKAKKKRKYTLEELLKDTTPEDYRNALSPEDYKFFQTDVGREIIDE